MEVVFESYAVSKTLHIEMGVILMAFSCRCSHLCSSLHQGVVAFLLWICSIISLLELVQDSGKSESLNFLSVALLL